MPNSNSSYKENFGSYLRSLRKNSGLTQAQLASMVGVKPQTIGKYESGIIKYPPIDKLLLIRNAIDKENSMLEHLLHSTSNDPTDLEYYDSFAKIITNNFYNNLLIPEFIVYLEKHGIDLNLGLCDAFLSKEIQTLIVAWDNASEKDKKTVAFILGFDYEPKEDDPAHESNQKGTRGDGGCT